jgi:MoxR-like ATPase
MQERQVTIGGVTHALPQPFFVMATQNPVEHEGTYPLPEAQTDRFLFKLMLDYPTLAEETEMLRRWGQATRSPQIKAVSGAAELLALREAVDAVYVAPEIEGYILALVRHTRGLADAAAGVQPLIYGASPRASLALYQAARGLALLRGLEHVGPSLVQALVGDVMRHRIGLSFEAEGTGRSADDILSEVIAAVAVPG